MYMENTYYNGNKFPRQLKYRKKTCPENSIFLLVEQNQLNIDQSSIRTSQRTEDGTIIAEWLSGIEFFDEKQIISIIYHLWRSSIEWFVVD
jgi:hypothetical protein